MDGETYFAAARKALIQARHSVLLLGWNFAEHGSFDPGEEDPDWPNEFGAFLHTLAERREDLRIHLLLWDKVPVLALGHRRVPGVQTAHMKSERLRYVLDTEHPPFASHHQKVLVIDDEVAFCGGFDFAANRWDTREHRPGDSRRRMPFGGSYEAHHDVMMMVEGGAARALADLARERWRIATGEHLKPAPPSRDAWPEDIVPDFTDTEVAIARTMPAGRGRPGIRECEALYLDAIAAAREVIYIENQYLAAPVIAEALAARLSEPDGPEIIIVNPKRAPSWTEQIAMDNARTQIVQRLRRADRHNRFRLFAAVNGDEEIVVHSKVMVVDDRLLRIGSSNLNNRSLGVDTECDLAIEAWPGSVYGHRTRRAITRIRDDLLAEHLGVEPARFSAAVTARGSVIQALDAMNGTSERRLVPFPPPRPSGLASYEHNALTDPYRPVGSGWPFLSRVGGTDPGRWRVAAVLVGIGILAGLALRYLHNTDSEPHSPSVLPCRLKSP